jgi:hypothetical protein
MDISTSTNIRIGAFQTFTVPDNLEIIYNGITIYSSQYSCFVTDRPIVVPITFVPGQLYVTFRITNSIPTSNTIWTINNVTCCSNIVCPTINDVPPISSISANINQSCGCTLTHTHSTYSLSCSGCGNPTYGTIITAGNCVWVEINQNQTCYNDNIIITKLTGASKSFDFSNNTHYTTVKNLIQSAVGDQRVTIQFHSATCGNDGTISEYNILPNHHTITYDDANYIITITVSATNPFANNCTDCNALKFNQYNTTYNMFNSTASTGTFQSIRYLRTTTSIKSNVSNNSFITAIQCAGGTCGPNLDRRYRITYRNTNCPCQSWELYEDTDDNGSYETLVLQETGWTGTCN